MLQSVGDDVAHMLVDEPVEMLPIAAFNGDQPGGPQDPQVLGHQRLAHFQSVDKLLHRPRRVGKFDHNGQANVSAEHPEQLRSAG